MIALILLSVVAMILNIAIYPLSKVTFREEDATRIAEGTLRVKTRTKFMPLVCWTMTGMFLLIFALSHQDMGSMCVLLFMDMLFALAFCVASALFHNSYYTIDDECLTYVKHGSLAWSHSWDEIDHARKRIVSTGKSFVIVYDIVTKDGVKHRSLPSNLGRDLKEHVFMDTRIPTRAKWIFAFLVALFAILMVIGMLTH